MLRRSHSPRWTRPAAVVSLLLLAACPGPLDQGPVPTSLRLNETAVTVNDGSSVQLTATVLDQNNRPLQTLPSGLTLQWTSSNESIGTVSGSGLVTGNRPGQARITASAGNLSAAADVTVRAVPTAVGPGGGDEQSGPAGAALPQPISVRVLDRHGEGVSGVPVEFVVTGGGGSVSPAMVTSDAAGIAQASWTLGSSLGEQTIEARVAALPGSSFVFRATARSYDAPVIASVSPEVLTPGGSATLQGTDLAVAGQATTVTVAGVAATVTAVTTTSVTIQLPTSGFACEPKRPVAVEVSVVGLSGSVQHPLQVAAQHSLNVGESLLLSSAVDVHCNELSQTGGRYLISVYNTSTALAATSVFELRGRAVPAPNQLPSQTMRPRVAAQPAARAQPQRRTEHAGEVFLARIEQQRERQADHAHQRVLEENLRLLRETPSPLPALRTRRALQPQGTTAAAPSSIGIVGAINEIRMGGPGCSAFTLIGARTAWVGQHAIIVEDTASSFGNGQPTLQGTLDGYYAEIGAEFDSLMWPIVREHFGNPLAMDALLRNHGKLIMVFSPRVNATGSQGFVFSGDMHPQTQCVRSNEAAIFYAQVPSQTGEGFSGNTPANWLRNTRSTIIHEVKHLATIAETLVRNSFAFEEVWLEEGMARLAEELYGRVIYGTTAMANNTYAQTAFCDVRPTWQQCVGRPRIIANHFRGVHDYLRDNQNRTPLGGDVSFYGSAWSLIRWAIDHHAADEAAFTRAITQSITQSGVANLEARIGRPFSEFLGEWSLALALDDRSGFTPHNSRLTMPSWNYPDIFHGMATTELPAIFVATPLERRSVTFGDFLVNSGTVRAGTFAIFELSGTQAAKQIIEVRGADGVPPAPLRMAFVRVE